MATSSYHSWFRGHTPNTRLESIVDYLVADCTENTKAEIFASKKVMELVEFS